MAMSARRWVESETRAELDVRGLTDGELSNLARYCAVVAVNTVARSPRPPARHRAAERGVRRNRAKAAI